MNFIYILMLCAFSYSVIALPKITVVTEDLWPLNYLQDGELKGKSANVVLSALEKSGLSYQLEVLPWPRAFKIATEQPNTVIFSIVRTKKREQQFHWLAQISTSDDIHIMTLSNSELSKENTKEQLLNYPIAVQTKSVSYYYLRYLGFKNIRQVRSVKQGILMLLNARVDLIVGRKSGMLKILIQLGPLTPKLKTVLISDVMSSYIAASLGTDPEIIEKLTRALKSHQQSK